MKTIISLVLGLSMLLPHGACNENAENWYLKRGKEGEAPQFPPSAEYIVEQNGFYMDNGAYANGEKVIYLTFDAGYENGNIAKILDILNSSHLPAVVNPVGLIETWSIVCVDTLDLTRVIHTHRTMGRNITT